MRALILIATAALCLAACRNNNQSANTANIDESLAAQNIVSNDVTAIDAVTGADANMAADVNYIDVPDVNDVNASRPETNATAPKPAKKPVATPRPAPATENATAPAAAATNGATE